MKLNNTKKGFLTLWSLGILILASVTITAGLLQKTDDYFWLDAQDLNDDFYIQLLTIEDWAKYKIEKGLNEELNPKNEDGQAILATLRSNKYDKEQKYVIHASIVSDDGKVNLSMMEGYEKNTDRHLIDKLINKLFPNFSGSLSEISKILEDGDVEKAKSKFGEYSVFFYHIVPPRSGLDSDRRVEDYEKININNMPQHFYDVFLEANPEASMSTFYRSSAEMKGLVGPEIYTLFRKENLFYQVEGSIMIEEHQKKFNINIDGKHGKSISRNLL